MIKNFVNALQFLTIFTVSKKHRATEGDLAKSLVYFPAIGFLLGLILVFSDKALSWILPHTIANVCLLIILIVTTRALHIDGLADTLDGIMGGADKESRLAIMKDSRIGTAGVLGIIFVLLLKYLSLNNLFNDTKVTALLTAPLLGRWSQILMVFRAKYVREQGMGRAFVGHLRASGLIAATILTIAFSIFVNEVLTAFLVAGVLIFTLLSRWCVIRKIGGVTGDSIGAVSELNEALTLLLIVILTGRG